MFKFTSFSAILLSAMALFMSNMSTTPMELEGNSLGAPEFDFRYQGEIETGVQAMPLIGQLSKDGDAMYYTSQTSRGKMLLYRMEREANGEFSEPERLEGLIESDITDVLMPTLTADEKTIVFVHSPKGFQKGSDLYIAESAGRDGAYKNVRPLDEINNPDLAEFYPWISADGLSIYYSRQEGKDIKIYASTRTGKNKRFSEPTKVDINIPKVENNMSAWLSNNELEMFVLSGNNIYYSTRTSKSDDFSSPIEIAKANSDGFLSGVTITQDQEEMYVYNSLGFRNTQLIRFKNAAERNVIQQDIDKVKIDLK